MSMKYLTVDQLADHPKNVRARTEYAEGSITGLAASIKALGLLQSLVVQQIEGGAWGVLAGRRRMLALRYLMESGDLEEGFKAPCKVIGKDIDHVTALSLAENTMQEPMAPIDEYDAFAAMIEEGESVEGIAESFGTTIRAVKERLRYGLVHGDIREAARAGTISLDVLKAYAGHPCTLTQKRVFDGFAREPHEHQSWRVRNVLAEQDIRADDPLAHLVIGRYREKGGEIVEGLFEEDTVLKDRALAESIRDDILAEEGKRLRESHGFKWVETRARLDFAELSGYGRIYPQALDLDEADGTRLAEIAERLDVIADILDDDAQHGDDSGHDIEALSHECDALEEEADRLQNGYLPEHTARAGLVIALGPQGNFRVEMGLVRPEDHAAWVAETEAATAAEAEAGEGEETVLAADGHAEARPAPIPIPSGAAPRGGSAYSTGASTGKAEAEVDPLSADALTSALRADLAVERAVAVAAVVSEDLALAYDLMVYRLAAGLLGRVGGYSLNGLSITAQEASRDHSRPEALDQSLLARIEECRGKLDLSFLDAAVEDGEKFRRFRDVDAGMKDRLVAAAMAMTNYWSRVPRGHMLALLEEFGMTAEAEEQRNAKKTTLAAYMEQLFAQPFATLTEEQRAAVEAWAPPGMGTDAPAIADDDIDHEPDGEGDVIEQRDAA